jgi:hypothetical protein
MSDPAGPSSAEPSVELSTEDAKLVTLARGARGRVGAAEGAAVRDETGRTYSGATVALPSLAVSALRLAVAQAVASGARGLEAAVVVRRAPDLDPADLDTADLDSADLDSADLDAVRDLAGAGVPVHVVGPDGSVLATLSS